MARDNKIIMQVSGTEIALTHRESVTTAGCLNAQVCCFYFDSAWESFGGRIALFGDRRDSLVPVALVQPVDGNDEPYYHCHIPRSVLAALTSGGEMYVCVQGTNPNGTPLDLADDAVLRTSLFRLAVSDSGALELYITEEETQAFLETVSAQLSTMRSETNSAMSTQRSENAAAIAALTGKAIASAVINSQSELVLTMENGTVYNLGNVRGPQGIQGDKGDTGDKGEKGDTGAKGDKGDTGESDFRLDVTIEYRNGGFYLTQADIDRIYDKKPAILCMHRTIGNTTEKSTYYLVADIGDRGNLVYHNFNNLDSTATNKYMRAVIPKVASSHVEMVERIYATEAFVTSYVNHKIENIDVSATRLDIDVEYRNGDYYITQADIDTIYEKKPAILGVTILQDGLTMKMTYTLLSDNEMVGMVAEKLVYQNMVVWNGMSNIFNQIIVPASAASPIVMRDFHYQEALSFDSIPTADSMNPVTSDGIKAYMDTAIGDIETALTGLISGGGVA
ncbi:MAG: collagen-like protein [Clostridia bacterium]|nr:collagen-like protein [Clostridia bacterium]